MENKASDNDKYLNKLHRDILTIMDEIDRICKENKLRYYLMCGSCLGAVRHHGFIPWDDDLDIAMPRKDFDKFIALFSKSEKDVMSEKLYIRWVTTENYYNHAFAKVCLKGTLFQEDCGKASRNAGIFVDIFPLDFCAAYNKLQERKNRLAKLFGYCLSYKGAENRKETWYKTWAFKVITAFFSNRAIHRMMLLVTRPQDERMSDYQAFYATPYPIRNMLFPKEWHGEGKEMLFEGRRYIVPFEAESYLQQIYGKDYMQIPPANKRKTHYPLRVIFSDGEEMIFERVIERVSYSDLIE